MPLTWTQDRLFKLRVIRNSLENNTRDLQKLIEGIGFDAPGRDDLIQMNEHFSQSERLASEVLEIGETARACVEGLSNAANSM